MPNKMYKKNILIVGGTGFIGYHLAKKAIQKKFSVTSLSTKPAKKIRYLKKVKYIYCDISNKQKLKNVIKINNIVRNAAKILFDKILLFLNGFSIIK